VELAGVLATLLGAVIALSPAAQAAEPFCRPQPPEPPLTRIQEYQEMRKLYGLRTDPAITKRTDTARYLRGRYGPRVRTRVVATELFSPRCRNLIDQVADGTRLTIGWQAGGTVELDHIEVAEYDDRVEIGVVVQSYNGPQPADWRRADAVVELSRPLGEREVVDATTGRLVPRRARRVLRKSRPTGGGADRAGRRTGP